MDYIKYQLKAYQSVNSIDMILNANFPSKAKSISFGVYQVGKNGYIGFHDMKFYDWVKEDMDEIPSDSHINAAMRDKFKYHITLCTDKKLMTPEFMSDIKDLTVDDFRNKGLGQITNENDETVYYLVINSDKMKGIYAKHGHPDRDLHITLGFSHRDFHNVRKDESTLI